MTAMAWEADWRVLEEKRKILSSTWLCPKRRGDVSPVLRFPKNLPALSGPVNFIEVFIKASRVWLIGSVRKSYKPSHMPF